MKLKACLHFKGNLHLGKITEPHLFNKEKSASPPRCRHHFNKVRVASPLWYLCLSNEWESCFYFRQGLHLQGNMTFASTRPMFSLYFCNQFNNTLAKAVGNFHWFNSTPTTSSKYQWGLDYVSGHSWWSSLVASKNLTVHSRRPKSKQDRAQGISEDGQSSLKSLLLKRKSESPKYFETRPSQSWSFENMEGIL